MSTVAATVDAGLQRTTRGRTRITARALQRVVAAVAGEALGVGADRVDATLTDHEGALDVAVHTPITVPSIARARAVPRALDRSGGSILERCAAAEHSIRDRVQDLTRHEIRRVTVRLTAVRIAPEGRVR